MDVLTREQRHHCMTQIKASNTKPEIALRKALFSLGFRYRLHRKDLPGTPDLVFPKFRAVIFIHGCFWHGHGCHMFVLPATNTPFWEGKIQGNRDRDERVLRALDSLDWRVLTVWECALRGRKKIPIDLLSKVVAKWLRGSKRIEEIASG